MAIKPLLVVEVSAKPASKRLTALNTQLSPKALKLLDDPRASLHSRDLAEALGKEGEQAVKSFKAIFDKNQNTNSAPSTAERKKMEKTLEDTVRKAGDSVEILLFGKTPDVSVYKAWDSNPGYRLRLLDGIAYELLTKAEWK